MIEKPITRGGEMVRAFLDGRKTQMRVIKEEGFRCPYGVPGDVLWVRETWGTDSLRHYREPSQEIDKIVYKADDDLLDDDHRYIGRWRPPLYMPRRASRINLVVKEIRDERLQDISEEDARLEGVEPWSPRTPELTYLVGPGGSYRIGFHALWDADNATRGFGWTANPQVWVGEFEVQKKERSCTEYKSC